MTQFMRWVEEKTGLEFEGNYQTLHQWSVDQYEDFWECCWEFFGIISQGQYERVVNLKSFENTSWFEGSLVNYAEHILRGGSLEDVVIVHASELRKKQFVKRKELIRDVRVIATQLRAMGVKPRDRVVAYMPNIYETTVAFLATSAIGAVWSSAAPEFGKGTVVDRFSQIEPKVIFCTDGYRYEGKDYNREAEVKATINSLPTLEHVIWLSYLDPDGLSPVSGSYYWSDLIDEDDPGQDDFTFTRVSSIHPLWIVYSSGTTGLPKPIIHSHIGALLEAFVVLQLHFNLRPGRRMFFHTTSGWIVWNLLIGGLCTGASIVLYDGSPTFPRADMLWTLVDECGITLFGLSPTYIRKMVQKGVRPSVKHNLSQLDSVMMSGSPAAPDDFSWFYDHVKSDLWVASVSGGTEIAGGFVGPSPLLPVRAGEIQCRMLGKDVHAYNESGDSVIGQVGELVCVKPIPSMPVSIWGDSNGDRYKKSYLEFFSGVWRHGDFLKISEQGGCYIKGRSDSSINRYGVRFGTSDIYRVLDKIEEVEDSLVVCYESEGAKLHMPLFVKLKENSKLDVTLCERIRFELREECSPRHVPDEIVRVDKIPYTLTGKKMEVPVRNIMKGFTMAEVVDLESLKEKGSLDEYLTYARSK
jgi:acetoacetyl-CoA synthetase